MIELITKLYLAFFKIGAFSFGGGYAMIPFIEAEIVKKNDWITLNEFMDIIGISQMTPGPVAINSATFVGFRVAGIIGSIFATLGVVTMSFILVSVASKAMDKLKDNIYLKSALLGIRPILIALIISAFLSLAKEAYIDLKSIIIGLAIGLMLLSKKINPILIICIAAVLGLVVYLV